MIKIPKTYELILDEKLNDINGQGFVLRHKKTNARISLISNNDDNKVFYIGFRTPPKNSTGVAHILEHSVLCGSEKFPSKEPFVELIKGSLNTFLNAMTYPDKTVYPVASCNDVDFQNLIDVYLDAVFFPNIYKKREIFEQEGWHYHLESKDDDITYNGVVYNEMKGVFSSPEEQLFRAIQNSLYKDTTYGVESGGSPENIVDLTYEEFIEFHKSYYHPSNSYIYLYGMMDFYEKLDFIDKEYLSKFNEIQVDSSISKQKPFNKREKITLDYALGDNEDLIDNTYLAYNFVIGDTLDKETTTGFQILDYVLLSAPGAPIKQALIDEGIGKDVFSSFQEEILQPMFSIVAKNANEKDKDRFVLTIENQLKKIVKEGINKKSLKAAINFYEFRYKEADFGSLPKGLIYGLGALGTWLYDDEKPFISLNGNERFEHLKTQVNTDFFANLIEKYLLNNTHSSIITLKPKKGLAKTKEQEIKEKLSKYKATLDEEDIERLIDRTKNLISYQNEPSKKEDLEKIPTLKKEDISKEARPFIYKEEEFKGIKLIKNQIYTNGIAYISLLFNIKDMPQSLVPYLSLLSNVLGIVDTKNYKYLELSNEINIETGGIYTSIKTYQKKNNSKDYSTFFEISTKVLYENIEKSFEFIDEIIYNTDFSNTKRIEEILSEIKSRIEMKYLSAGHSVAVERAMSYYSEYAMYKEYLSGIEFYNILKDILNNFEERKDDLIAKFKDIMKLIFTKDRLIINLTANQKGYEEFSEKCANFIEKLNACSKEKVLGESYKKEKPKIKKLNEGFMTSSSVQYVARVGNFMDAGYNYVGALKVLRVILSYDYLWNNVRVKGGAYGCMNAFSSISGDSYFVSYRDPNLRETNKVYENVVPYIKEFSASDRDITKYIIGTISGLDTPLTAKMEGTRNFAAYISNTTFDDVQKERDEIINVNVDDIRALAPLVEAVLRPNNICVVGSQSEIEKEKDLFNQIKHLI